jgi:hypothetical protein
MRKEKTKILHFIQIKTVNNHMKTFKIILRVIDKYINKIFQN